MDVNGVDPLGLAGLVCTNDPPDDIIQAAEKNLEIVQDVGKVVGNEVMMQIKGLPDYIREDGAIGHYKYYTQGVVNTVNGLQDVVIGTINLAPGLWNITGEKLTGYKMGHIPSPDWSKNLIVHEHGTHKTSKLVGGESAMTLITMGISNWRHARHVDKIKKGETLLDSGKKAEPLVHLTNDAGKAGIEATDVIIGNNGGIYALPEKVVEEGTLWKACRGGLTPNRTKNAIQITEEVLPLFEQPTVTGLWSLWKRGGGARFLPSGTLNNATGVFTFAEDAFLTPEILMNAPDVLIYSGTLYYQDVLNKTDELQKQLGNLEH